MRYAAAFASLSTALLLCWQQPALAVDPFVVDDTRVDDPGRCQLESSARVVRRDPERGTGFTLGCTPSSYFTKSEFSAHTERTSLGDAGVDRASSVQWKMLYRSLDDDSQGRPWGLGLSLGTGRQRPANDTPSTQPYFNLLGGLPLVEDRLLLHANLGAYRDRPAQRTQRTWGMGLEWSFNDRWSAIGEHYRQDDTRASSQLGVRYSLIPDRVQIDLLTGTQPADDRRNWTSLGLRLMFP